MATGLQKIVVLLCVFLLYVTLPSIQAEKHSLYYIYTGLSKTLNLSGIYEFSAMGLLDDTQFDYYNSKEKRKIPTQPWMKENLTKDYWTEGTQSRKEKEKWFHLSLQNLKKRMYRSESDLHVLQQRVGCEVEQQGNEFNFSKGVYEYSYDGENFLSFDIKEAQWVAAVDAALLTKRKWDRYPRLNKHTKIYLEEDCVYWLNKYREYAAQEELRKTSPPDVYMFAKKSIRDKTRLNLTCLATGFYPKDVMKMIIRKNNISLLLEEINSTGIRPNHDGSFQMRNNLEIKDEKDEYDCLVYKRTLKEPINTKWDGTCKDCPPEIDPIYRGVVIGVVLTLAVVAFVFCILVKMNIIDFRCRRPHEHL